MTLRHLKIFCTVAKTGSITAAAEQLYISQPSVSVAIRELENYYGIRLFDRLSRRIYITDDGRRMLAYASHIVELVDEMEKVMSDPGATKSLKIGASITVSAVMLPALEKYITDRHPEIDVRVRTASSEVIEDAVLKNEIDFGIIEGVAHSEYIESSVLADDELCAVCAVNHKFAGRTVSLDEFLSQPLLMREQGSGTRELFDRAAAAVGRSYVPVWESTSTRVIVNGVESGLGVSVLPDKLISGDVADGKLSRLKIDGIELKRPIFFIKHRDKHLSDIMKEVIAYGNESFGKK